MMKVRTSALECESSHNGDDQSADRRRELAGGVDGDGTRGGDDRGHNGGTDRSVSRAGRDGAGLGAATTTGVVPDR